MQDAENTQIKSEMLLDCLGPKPYIYMMEKFKWNNITSDQSLHNLQRAESDPFAVSD